MSQTMRQISFLPQIKDPALKKHVRCKGRGCAKMVSIHLGSGQCDECRTLKCSCGATWVYKFVVDETIKKTNRLKCRDCTRSIKGIVNRTGAEGI